MTDAIVKRPTGKFAASALLLEQYFHHRGDWKKMESELSKHSNEKIPPEIVERVVHLISSTLMATASKV